MVWCVFTICIQYRASNPFSRHLLVDPSLMEAKELGCILAMSDSLIISRISSEQ